MRKLIVSEFISLDGVIQAPGGVDEDTDGGFAHGAWTLPYWHDDIGASFVADMQESDAFLLGRKTWQEHGMAFDKLPAGDFFGDMMNGKKKYVVSNTLTSTEVWRNSEIIRGDVVAEIRRIKSLPGKNIAIDGSSVLVKTLHENDLVDEYRLLVYPVVLGKGKRLFADGGFHKLQHVESRVFPTGVVLTRYAKASAE